MNRRFSEDRVDFSQVVFEDWMIHPPDVQIDQYISGLLKGEVLVSIERHLEKCPHCRKEVEMLNIPCPSFTFAEDADPETCGRIRRMMRDYAASRIRPLPDPDWS